MKGSGLPDIDDLPEPRTRKPQTTRDRPEPRPYVHFKERVETVKDMLRSSVQDTELTELLSVRLRTEQGDRLTMQEWSELGGWNCPEVTEAATLYSDLHTAGPCLDQYNDAFADYICGHTEVIPDMPDWYVKLTELQDTPGTLLEHTERAANFSCP